MQDFEIPVFYQGKELLFSAHLLSMGFIYKIEVDVNSINIQFERDEENEWRAIVNQENTKNIDVDLIKEIAGSLKNLFD